VHCRAGIGRTGTTVGCHLIRGGCAPLQAIEELQKLWQQCARSRTWLSIPETDEQIDFVRNWREARVAPDPAERCEGALTGLAIGDALGGLLASGRHDSQQLAQFAAFEATTLETGADTAMTLAVAESLLATGRHDAEDQMRRYLLWSRSATAANIPVEFKRALAAWQWSRKANVATHDPKNLDPHTLARSLAAALHLRSDPDAAIDLAAEVSRTTHQSPLVLDMCRFWTALLIDALRGEAKADLLTMQRGKAMQVVRTRRLRKELDDLLQRRWAKLAQEDRGVLSACARALYAFENTESFDAGLLAIGASPVGATVGALYGALAGAHYGIAAIPEQWRRALPQLPDVRALAQRFAE
jgi:ADP-ribosyl-[dinitrogen reductase] hydrolase